MSRFRLSTNVVRGAVGILPASLRFRLKLIVLPETRLTPQAAEGSGSMEAAAVQKGQPCEIDLEVARTVNLNIYLDPVPVHVYYRVCCDLLIV